MRVLLPFGSSNKCSSSENISDNCVTGEGSTSFVNSNSSRNNSQAFCITCEKSDLNEVADFPDLNLTQASSGSCDIEILSNVVFKSEDSLVSFDEEAQKVSICSVIF
jgi:hypothetical protein